MMYFKVQTKPRYGSWTDHGEYAESTSAKSAANNYGYNNKKYQVRVVKIIEEVVYEI